LEQHIKIVSVIYIVFGILGMIGAVIIFVAGVGSGLLSGDPDAAIAGGTCGTIFAVVVAVLSLPSLIAGLGLKNRKEWARILTIILSALNLLNFPIGTAIGGYALWVLLNDQARPYFVR
jgi:hypothetical protein